MVPRFFPFFGRGASTKNFFPPPGKNHLGKFVRRSLFFSFAEMKHWTNLRGWQIPHKAVQVKPAGLRINERPPNWELSASGSLHHNRRACVSPNHPAAAFRWKLCSAARGGGPHLIARRPDFGPPRILFPPPAPTCFFRDSPGKKCLKSGFSVWPLSVFFCMGV